MAGVAEGNSEEGRANGLVAEAVGEVISPAAEAHNPSSNDHGQNQPENIENHNLQSSDLYNYSNNQGTHTEEVEDGGGGEQREYTAWEYQEYINVILQELELVRSQLAESQEAAASALSLPSDHQLLQQNQDAAGLGLYVTSKEYDMAKAEIARLQTVNQEILERNNRYVFDFYFYSLT